MKTVSNIFFLLFFCLPELSCRFDKQRERTEHSQCEINWSAVLIQLLLLFFAKFTNRDGKLTRGVNFEL